MKAPDFPAFAANWFAAFELYGKPTSDVATKLAFDVLSRFELVDVLRALQSHVLDSDAGRFPPKPADLVKFITGDTQSKPLAAWTAVSNAVERIGPYRAVTFDDPVTMATLADMGGWAELCRMTDETLPFRRNEFCTRYRGYMLTPPASFPARLGGLSTDGAPPVLIGDPQRAAATLANGSNVPRLAMRGAGDVLRGQLERKP